MHQRSIILWAILSLQFVSLFKPVLLIDMIMRNVIRGHFALVDTVQYIMKYNNKKRIFKRRRTGFVK